MRTDLQDMVRMATHKLNAILQESINANPNASPDAWTETQARMKSWVDYLKVFHKDEKEVLAMKNTNEQQRLLLKMRESRDEYRESLFGADSETPPAGLRLHIRESMRNAAGNRDRRLPRFYRPYDKTGWAKVQWYKQTGGQRARALGRRKGEEEKSW